MLESQSHEHNYFVTLTYDNDHLPEGGNLVPAHPQGFLKRVRYYCRTRFFLVGEYGDESWRPHYHLLLFGLGEEVHFGCGCGKCRECRRQGRKSRCTCVLCGAWTYGLVHIGTVTQESVQYTASYVEKKLTSSKDVRLGGRFPEFTRMSRKPGIGASYVDSAVVPFLHSYAGCIAIRNAGDVPGQLRLGGSLWPLGRYLRDRARVQGGYPSGEPLRTKERRLRAVQAELMVPGAVELRDAKRDRGRRLAKWKTQAGRTRKKL